MGPNRWRNGEASFSDARNWDLASLNLSQIRERVYEAAVIPVGALEPHNLHLPYGQDLFHTRYVARRCCAEAAEKDARVVCLPAVPYGVDCNLMDFPMTLHVAQATLDRVMEDLLMSLKRHGIRKVLILNGHGGNDFKPFIRRFQCEHAMHVFQCHWWKVGMDRYETIFSAPDDHAGEMETSVALYLYPELVEMDKAGPGTQRPFRFEALRKGWVQTSRRFGALNDHCAAGDPRRSSAEKGKTYLDLVCGRIRDFLVELSRAELTPDFPFETGDG